MVWSGDGGGVDALHRWMGAWASISGAVIAPGVVAVEGKPKTIQHGDGGIVGEILVRDGDRVDVGDILTGSTQRSSGEFSNRPKTSCTRRSLSSLGSKLSFAAHQSRYPIPTSGHCWISRRCGTSSVASTSCSWRGLASRSGQIEQWEQRVVQYEEQIEALDDLHAAHRRQADLTGQELEGLRKLHARGHVPHDPGAILGAGCRTVGR